ncbi:MAG: glycine betaine ABC transporter substrate-binding protein [Rubrobacteraceae bacterium]
MRKVFPGIVAVLFALILAAGCGGQGSSGSGGSIAEEFDLSGPQDTAQFIVGSKDFTEQRILGEIAVQALQAAGADVTARLSLGGNEEVRQALIDNDIDMYWEYTGTGWLVHLGNPDPIPDPQEQYQAVAEQDLEENNIEWLDRAPGNNTYAIAASQDTLSELGVENISDLVRLTEENPEEATLCYGNENDFSSRSDGLPGLEEAYDFQYPEDSQIVVPLDSVYQNVAEGERCNFGVVFTTNGLIDEQNLELIEDDENFFAVYNPAMIVKEQKLEEYPELEELFAPISEELDTETLLELNSQVDIEGETPTNVAEQWLQENGFVE